MLKGKVSVIGTGFVGSTTAYTLMTSGLVSEIALIDIDADKAEGDAMDMNHGISFVSPVKITAGGYENLAGSGIVIIAAGANQKEGETRTGLLKRNAAILKDIVGKVLEYCGGNGIILVVSNPVDILTHITYKLSGFPRSRVIGSGTVLDTSRLRYLIGRQLGIDARNIHSYIIGEHGDSEVAAWSTTTIAGMKFDEFCRRCGLCTDLDCKARIYDEVRNAAYDIISKKGATYYAIALAVRRIVEAVIGNENSVLTVSSHFDGEYGIRDICLSAPTVVNSSGAGRILETPFSPEELGKLRDSADILKRLAKEVGF